MSPMGKCRMGKCRLWVNVAWVIVAMGICCMGICRLTSEDDSNGESKMDELTRF